MTELGCSVRNCLHNADGCCCKREILVDGYEAKEAFETCCASFDEAKEGLFSNLFQTPETRLTIECDAVRCRYNEDNRCQATRVDIAGDGAADSMETRCATFTAK